MDKASDEELMLRVARGDERAFGELTRRYLPRAVGIARRIVRSAADAEDIVQDAFLRLWINAPRWRPISSFRTWFYRVLVNLCLNHRRRAPFIALDRAGDPPDPSAGAGERLEADEIDRALAAAIGALPARQRAAIVLSYREGLSNAEAAAVLDTSVSALETLLVRAKKSLRQTLHEFSGG